MDNHSSDDEELMMLTTLQLLLAQASRSMILIDLLGYFSSRLDYLKALGDDSLLVESISIKFMGGRGGSGGNAPVCIHKRRRLYARARRGGGLGGNAPVFPPLGFFLR